MSTSSFSFSFALDDREEGEEKVVSSSLHEGSASGTALAAAQGGTSSSCSRVAAEEVPFPIAAAAQLEQSQFEGDASEEWSEGPSDLIAGVYEGGLKVWECTQDLLTYLEEINAHSPAKGTLRVLDIGCGHGDLGCWALARGWSCDFQDYNKNVLETVTMPRVRAACCRCCCCCASITTSAPRSRFFAGDWGALCDEPSSWSDAAYDLVLTSETLVPQR